MKIIDSPEAMARALASPLDPLLDRVLRLRFAQLQHDGLNPFDLATFTIIDPGDRLADVEAGLKLPIATNLVDGSHYGDPDFVPSTEWIADHGGLFEMVYVLSDDGAGVVILVPDRPDIDPALLTLCRTYADFEAATRMTGDTAPR